MVHDTIGDVHGLHSKLERKSHVEETNLSAASQFQSAVHSDVSALRENVQGYSSAQLQACRDFSGRIGEYVYLLRRVIVLMVSCVCRRLGQL